VTVTLNSWPGGNFVSISSETGYRTGYAHLQTVLVNTGDLVQAGAQIGTVGSTGYSTGPHLHYEIWRDGVNIDPTPLLQCS
jgi:murein DD-endopeptidase MepM/ murein hydrolase activator NlpD